MNRVDANITRQYLFRDRGLRVFTYDHDRFVRSSSPLPASGAPLDPIVIRAALEPNDDSKAFRPRLSRFD